jgi:hypothetical protein
MMKHGHILHSRYFWAGFLVTLVLLFAGSCSTTRVVPEGSYRLVDNYVHVVNQEKYPEYDADEIQSYIRQKPNSYFIRHWSPFLSVYNWSDGSGSWWDRTVKKIGQEPVLMDATLVEQSKSNMETHLQYLGYYHSRVLDSISAQDRRAEVFYDIHLG